MVTNLLGDKLLISSRNFMATLDYLICMDIYQVSSCFLDVSTLFGKCIHYDVHVEIPIAVEVSLYEKLIRMTDV